VIVPLVLPAAKEHFRRVVRQISRYDYARQFSLKKVDCCRIVVNHLLFDRRLLAMSALVTTARSRIPDHQRQRQAQSTLTCYNGILTLKFPIGGIRW